MEKEPMSNGHAKITLTNRKCRGCNAFLPVTRYFECFECKPELANIDENFLYSYEGPSVTDVYDYWGYSALGMIEAGETTEEDEDDEGPTYQEDEC